MNDLQIFRYSDKQVRTLIKDGEPWFVLKDVCDILGIQNHKDVAARLDTDEKGVDLIDTPGGTQQTTIINEPGLYNVILRSDKPESKAFKRWITHEVLPSIRRTGSYHRPMSQVEILHQMTAAMLEQERQLKAIEGTVNNIKEAVISDPDNWREDINHRLNKIAKAIGPNKFRDIRSESYKILESRAGVNLERRLGNLKVRLLQNGASKSKIDSVGKIDVIDEDKKLREIYSKIVSELIIRYCA